MRSKPNPANTLTSLLMGLSALIACAGQAACEASQKPGVGAQAPSIEGTYTLVSRDLPNGTKQGPPDLVGMLTYTKEYRNFNLYVKDARGKTFSIASIGTYTLTDKAYSETNIYYLVNDGIEGMGVSYDLAGSTGTSPVSVKESRIEFQLPLHSEPSVVFAGDKFTATRQGAFVDHWEKVK